jgi:hypothetical protein
VLIGVDSAGGAGLSGPPKPALPESASFVAATKSADVEVTDNVVVLKNPDKEVALVRADRELLVKSDWLKKAAAVLVLRPRPVPRLETHSCLS